MTWQVRPARAEDLDALHALAQTTGPGFTNIPASHEGMAARLAWSMNSFAKTAEVPGDDLYLLVLEDGATGTIAGTAMLFGEVGAEWPFYSYKISRSKQYSRALKRTVTAELLNLVTDMSGSSEVGGLFLRADLRASGLGRLLSRSRYLFIAAHRARFGRSVISELRGWLAPDGQSPFWDAIGRLFFDMDFVEADRFNATNGNQFIADLMPKHPIYIAMLPDAARKVLGRPHDYGAGAMKLLEREGFAYDGYCDIFDGGPTLCAPTDSIATIRASHEGPVTGHGEGALALIARGRLREFRVTLAAATREAEGWRVAADAGPAIGEEIRAVAL